MNFPGISSNLKTEAKGLDITKYTTLGAPILAIVVSLIVLFIVVYPRFSQALKLRSSNSELASRVDALNAKSQILSAQNETELRQQYGLAEQAIPSEKAVFAALRQVETVAGQSGVILERVDVAPGSVTGNASAAVAGSTADTNASGATKVDIKISTTSDYNSLLKFLTSLYALPRVLGIRDLTVAAGGSSSGTALHGDMVVEAYWKALPNQLGSVESAVENITPSEKAILDKVREAGLAVSASSSAAPVVQTGRSDLFAPF